MDKTRHPSPERINRYLEGALKGAARDAVERHFMACESCFERVRLELGVELVGAGSDTGKERTARQDP